MTSEILNLGEIRYNPEQGAFEALVRIFDAGEVYAYPVHIHAPLNADFDMIARGLTQKARKVHRSQAQGLRLVHAQAANAAIHRGPALAA